MAQHTRAGRRRILRCPACGEPLEKPVPSHCPLCKLDFRDDRVTGVDVTPYARTFLTGEPGWWRMCEWVWFAGGKRLKHLTLMRASAASNEFAHTNLLLVTMALGLLACTHVGWRKENGSVKPAGLGWLHVVSTPSHGATQIDAERTADLWWNLGQSIIGGVVALVLGLAAIWFVRRLIGWGLTIAHARPRRNEQRLSAALDYGTAWVVPLLLGSLVLALRPIAVAGTIADWRWSPSVETLELSAGVLGGFGVAMWWFWLIRLGFAAPTDSRARVVAFLLVAAPVVVVGPAAASWWCMDRVCQRLFAMMGFLF